jgi:RNA polymerase sigma-70 factor, ECF subfamily
MSPRTSSIRSELPTSEELLTLAGNNDVTAFNLLYERHSSAAMNVALATTRNRSEAEDAVQEAFLVLWRSSRRYDSQRASVATWLAMIVRRRAIEQLRRRRPTTGLPDDDALPSSMATQDVWTEVAPRLDRIQLLAALADLPPRQRNPLQLAFFGEFSHVEVADHLGTPLGTTKGRIRAGLRALRRGISAE